MKSLGTQGGCSVDLDMSVILSKLSNICREHHQKSFIYSNLLWQEFSWTPWICEIFHLVWQDALEFLEPFLCWRRKRWMQIKRLSCAAFWLSVALIRRCWNRWLASGWARRRHRPRLHAVSWKNRWSAPAWCCITGGGRMTRSKSSGSPRQGVYQIQILTFCWPKWEACSQDTG